MGRPVVFWGDFRVTSRLGNADESPSGALLDVVVSIGGMMRDRMYELQKDWSRKYVRVVFLLLFVLVVIQGALLVARSLSGI